MTIQRSHRRSLRKDRARYISRTIGNTTIVAARGEIDAHNAGQLHQQAMRRNVIGQQALILDLAGLTFLSTQGLFTLLAIGQQCHRADINCIVVPSRAVSRLLQISHTYGDVCTAETVPAALTSLRQQQLPESVSYLRPAPNQDPKKQLTRAEHLPELHQGFQNNLHAALVDGRSPGRSTGLGPQTLAALTLVAAEHPDTSADTIAAAYDAFLREHGQAP